MYTDVITGKKLDVTRRKTANKISGLIQSIDAQEAHLLLENSLKSMTWNDSFRILVEGLDCQQAYRNLILNSAYVINNDCPYAVAIYLSAVRALLELPSSTPEMFSRKIAEMFSARRGRRVSSKVVINSWKRSVNDDMLWDNREFIIKAIQECGMMGNVRVKRSRSKQAFMEVRDGLRLNCRVSPGFHINSRDPGTLSDARIIVVDGMVNEVSEIHRVLSESNEKDIDIAIFASAFSPDVENTLSVNWQSGKLRVLPFVMEKGLDDINQIRDICEPLGITPVSKDTGKILSGIDLEEEPAVIRLRISDSRDCVVVSPQEKQVLSILRMRKEMAAKLRKEKTEDIRDILKNRLSKFSSRTVVLSIPCQSSEEGIVQDRVGSFFKFVSQCASQGVYDTKKIEKYFPIISGKSLPDIMPAASVARAINRAIADVKAISNIGCVISLDS